MVFLEDSELSNIYPDLKSIESFYAYSLRNYKVGKVNKALEYINKCIEIDKLNPIFMNLRDKFYLKMEEQMNLFYR